MSSGTQPTPNIPDNTAGPLVVGAARLNSVDLLRGLVMAIMALDHVRDYFTHLQFQPEDMRFTYPALFYTRFITHFCAPCFFFLAGTGAFLSRKEGAELSNFLWKRGLWLIILEFTVIAFAWTFTVAPFIGMIVIWALGAAMIFLAGLVRLPLKWVAAISIGMIVLHNAFDTVTPAVFGKLGWLWLILHQQGFIPLSKQGGIFVAYPLVPWIGVMGAGYAFGAIMKFEAERRRKTLLMLGGAMTLAFLVLRIFNIYGHQPYQRALPSEAFFHAQPTLAMTIVDLLDTQKYPPSLQYLLMTLGPAIMLLTWFEKIDLKSGLGLFWDKILVFGRVPMFYYLCHLYLIHLMAIASVFAFRQPGFGWLTHGAFFFGSPPPGYGHNLPYIYLMWITAVVILYFPCKWFAGVKARRKDWWLSYL